MDTAGGVVPTPSGGGQRRAGAVVDVPAADVTGAGGTVEVGDPGEVPPPAGSPEHPIARVASAASAAKCARRRMSLSSFLDDRFEPIAPRSRLRPVGPGPKERPR